ncbi:MAG: phenylalanine--tRNA ligase subunit alpha, partial [Alphaproteobacteria bacterium]|nr:phenylalanine--tRNA ligase subunit alpha [Alphaproteobacteria bacterium]
MADIDSLREKFLSDINQAENLDQLTSVKVDALGKKGAISSELAKLGQMDADSRKQSGQLINAVKQEITSALAIKQETLAKQALDLKLKSEKIDVTLPSRPALQAKMHPLSRTMEEISAIFADMGFVIAEGPEIETDENNFTALNIPAEHPARQEHDTFYLKPDADGNRPVLRTHTSPVQIRTMRSTSPPIRIIVPGRTYRSDHDATHSPMFHQ